MTLEEANQLLALVKVNYNYAFKTMTKQEKVMLVKSWAFVLQDIPADIVTLAFMQLVSTHKFLPTPAEIRDQVRNLYYSAAYHDTSGMIQEKDRQADRVRKYIVDKTSHLRGDHATQLSLDTILHRGYGRTLGTGEQEFLTAGTGEHIFLPENETEDEE